MGDFNIVKYDVELVEEIPTAETEKSLTSTFFALADRQYTWSNMRADSYHRGTSAGLRRKMAL